MGALARPFGMLLMFLYDLVNNYGVAILLFAVVIRVILLPFQMKSKYGMMQTARIQPKLADLQKRFSTNKARLNEETQKLYKEEGINPASGCIWGILPLPIMFALFLVIREPLTMMLGLAPDLLEEGGRIFEQLTRLGFFEIESGMNQYYVQVDQAQFISAHFEHFSDIEGLIRLDFNFLGINLGRQPRWDFLWSAETNWSDSSNWLPGLLLFIIPFLSGGTQMIASRINQKMNPSAATGPGGQAASMQTMMMLMPLISVYFAFVTPAALGFYWTAGTILQIGQDFWLTKKYSKRIEAEEAVRKAEREKKEAEIEAKRLETERKKAEGVVERNPNISKRKKQATEKQEQIEKAAEWQKKNAPPKEEKVSPSREGHRRYARGRAYDPDRYTRGAAKNEDENDFEEKPEYTAAGGAAGETGFEDETDGGAAGGTGFDDEAAGEAGFDDEAAGGAAGETGFEDETDGEAAGETGFDGEAECEAVSGDEPDGKADNKNEEAGETELKPDVNDTAKRRFSRGRAYDPDRYKGVAAEDGETPKDDDIQEV